MNTKDAIDKIKILLGITPEVKKFADAKLKDGSILRYEGETPAVGMAVILITQDGELPAPDGKYELEDGTTLVVAGSAITEIVPASGEPEAVEPVAPEQDMTQAPATDGNGVKKETTIKVKEFSAEDAEALKAEIFAKVAELESKLESVKTENETLKAENVEFKKQAEEVKEIVSKIAEMPAAEPTENKERWNRTEWIKEQKKGFKALYENISKQH